MRRYDGTAGGGGLLVMYFSVASNLPAPPPLMLCNSVGFKKKSNMPGFKHEGFQRIDYRVEETCMTTKAQTVPNQGGQATRPSQDQTERRHIYASPHPPVFPDSEAQSGSAVEMPWTMRLFFCRGGGGCCVPRKEAVLLIEITPRGPMGLDQGVLSWGGWQRWG